MPGNKGRVRQNAKAAATAAGANGNASSCASTFAVPTRNDAEPRLAAADPVRDFGDGAVAAGGDNEASAAVGGLPRQLGRVAGVRGFRQFDAHAVGEQHIQHAPQAARSARAGRRVEDNQQGGMRIDRETTIRQRRSHTPMANE